MDPEALVNMAQLEERVRAAARMVPPKGTGSRRLETRNREQFVLRNSWMIPLHGGTRDVFAVELVPCASDAPGAVTMSDDTSEQTVRLNSRVLLDLWFEDLPAGMLAELPAAGAEVSW